MGHRVFPHGELEPLTTDLWRVRGRLSIPLHRNMVVWRTPDERLLLHSVVALDAVGMGALEQLGQPGIAIVPSSLHLLDAAYYARRYPKMKFIAPSAAKSQIGARVELFGTCEEVLPELGIGSHMVPGTRAPECVYDLPTPGGRTLVFNDVLGGPNAHVEGAPGSALVRRLAVPNNTVGFARIYRWRNLRDVESVRALLGELAQLPDVGLATFSHGEPVREDVSEVLLSVSRDSPRRSSATQDAKNSHSRP